MKLRYAKRAREDVRLNFLWYEAQRRGLGFEFLDSVEHSIQLIMENPAMYPVRYANYRGCVIRRFPFSVLYKVEDAEIVLYAVFDNRQDPRKRP